MKTKESPKVPVTEKALVQRINRALGKDMEKLCKARSGSRMEMEWGPYYVVGTGSNRGVVDWRVDIEEKGRELGALKAFEELAS